MLLPIRCRFHPLLALPMLCWAIACPAASPLSADEAVTLALAQPPVRQELGAGIAAAESDVLAARLWPNPELHVEQERGDAASGDARETTAVLSQTFELGGRRALQRQAADLGVLAAGAAADAERARLRADVLRAYSDVVAGEQRRAAHARTAAALATLADVASRRQREGDLSGYERRRIAQAAAQAQARADEAGAQALAARARLAGFIGDVAHSAEVDAAPPLPPVPDAAGDVQSAELDALQARRDHAEALARAERRPSLPVTVGLGTKRLEHGAVSENAVIVEVGVPLPLFDRNQAGRARAAAEADLAAARHERARMQAVGRRDAALAIARQLSASATQLRDSAVPEAARLTGIARASFAEGELDLVGLLDAHQAETELVEHALDQHARALDALLELQLLSPLSPSNPASH